MKTSNKAPRFFIAEKIYDESLSENKLIISDEKIIHQIKNVLRKKEGESVVILDGRGSEFFGTIFELSKKEIKIEKDKINFYEKDNFERDITEIILAPAILKKDNFEFVMQKCTEIGVKNFQPIISERTEKDNLNFERLEKITKEASEQSEKIFLPEIFQTKKLEEFLTEKTNNLSNESNFKIFALEFSFKKYEFSKFRKITGEIIFLIGPEGGWGEEDLKLFEKFNVEKVSLGSQILRAETASISLATLLLLGE